jgi:UDP-N-acetylmuramoyl-L-alanyl-D-glutamate--2,6-diaminopimelate ligase
MTLQQVLAGVPLRSELTPELLRKPVFGLEYDSRRVQPGYLFFAFPGSKTDGREFAGVAIEKGAVAVVSESERPGTFKGAWITVAHGRKALAWASRNFYHRPDERLCLAAITGTNGKTTTSFLIDSILRTSGHTTALIGTIEYRLAGELRPAVNTTPESLDLYRIFAELEAVGGTPVPSYVTMEVSSHALALGRVFGISFHTAVFTNLTRDHLDFHGTMEDYFAAKQQLFTPSDTAPPKWAVVNHDDPYGRQIRVNPGTRRLSYGFEAGANLHASRLEGGFQGLSFTIEHEGKTIALTSPMVGKINAYNILAACGTALSYGLDWNTIATGIAQCRAVPGRFERVDEGQPFMVVVDYAHTDDALRNVIAVARGLSPKRVITLFGCGGDRDRTKRPLMGMAAAEGSDFVVLTSDNPRSEDPLAIINDALVGLRRYDVPHLIEPDRGKAIRAAIGDAREGDIVILAGKGHETYQVFKDQTIHFDDREVARKALR